MNPDDWDQVQAELFAPVVPATVDPDRVSRDVVDEEMSLFASFSRQNQALGG